MHTLIELVARRLVEIFLPGMTKTQSISEQSSLQRIGSNSLSSLLGFCVTSVELNRGGGCGALNEDSVA